MWGARVEMCLVGLMMTPIRTGDGKKGRGCEEVLAQKKRNNLGKTGGVENYLNTMPPKGSLRNPKSVNDHYKGGKNPERPD